MNSIRLVLSLLTSLLFLSCGDARESYSDLATESLSIYADKGVYFDLTISSEGLADSLLYRDEIPIGLRLSSDNFVSTVTAMLVPGCGSGPVDRMEYLSWSDVRNLDTVYINPIAEIPGFTAVVYVSGDSSVVERVWSRGSGELAILQAKSGSTSLNFLLSSVTGLMSTAELSEPTNGLSRSVYLSDRIRSEIVEEVNADVTEPPEVSHRIALSVDPLNREINVIDSLSIDFTPTQSDSEMTIYLPECDNGASFYALSGTYVESTDSILCVADSSRIFSGLYHGSWNGFISVSTDIITQKGLQINPSTSFQSGMWFYPGCSVPSTYALDVSVPDIGYQVFVPLMEVSREVMDSVLTVSYLSPIGGIRGPLSWAVGGFTENAIANGRSRYICLESDSVALEMKYLADYIASVLWRNMDYEGAMLDFVIVRSLDVPVFITGPGCVFISTDMLASIGGYETWSDSLVQGVPVPETAIVYETAKAYLAGSTYLSDNLRDVLAAWSVYRFTASGDRALSTQLLEAFRKYYLYSTEITGGTEYAIADPRLIDSPLYEPVILGKAPLVMEFLINEIPAFERAVPRALGNLRHSGDSFSRLFSAMGIWESSGYGEMFFQWLYNPGIPQIEVSWVDSSGTLYLFLNQFQPGQDFPLGSITGDVRIFTETGYTDLDLTLGSTEGFYTADIPGSFERIIAVDIDPGRILPADIVYRHLRNQPNVP